MIDFSQPSIHGGALYFFSSSSSSGGVILKRPKGGLLSGQLSLSLEPFSSVCHSVHLASDTLPS